LLLKFGDVLFKVERVPDIKEAPGSVKRWDGGLLHVVRCDAESTWCIGTADDDTARPVALYSALVPSGGRVTICNTCHTALRKAVDPAASETMRHRFPKYNVARWRLTAPPGFRGIHTRQAICVIACRRAEHHLVRI